ncbi:MAG: hypothetical protein HOO06_14475 [Bdellovibrionaceae bacterium]|jgi:hypothetical protein|nr:hypothetical protein [Pseudobdellovibrionaceae bacterium]
MKISTQELRNELTQKQGELKHHLPSRISLLLDELKDKELSKVSEISIFELLVRIILKADEEPAQNIADLLIPLNGESSLQLDNLTISSSAAFLSDYLKKDQLLLAIES